MTITKARFTRIFTSPSLSLIPTENNMNGTIKTCTQLNTLIAFMMADNVDITWTSVDIARFDLIKYH